MFLNWGLVFLGLGIGDFQNPKNINPQFKITNWSFYDQQVISTFNATRYNFFLQICFFFLSKFNSILFYTSSAGNYTLWHKNQLRSFCSGPGLPTRNMLMQLQPSFINVYKHLCYFFLYGYIFKYVQILYIGWDSNIHAVCKCMELCFI